MIDKKVRLLRRKMRIRKKIFGTKDKPRVSVFRSNRYIYLQAIDDTLGHTIASSYKIKKQAFECGKELGEKLLKLNILRAVFDRNGRKYHGRVKEAAEGIRASGIKL
ncbi:MAG: 50S ribosomal protein L18 [bacterium]|nr:50S ribosomal protein L18 [bacterium]